jgi:hypothetical protein
VFSGKLDHSVQVAPNSLEALEIPANERSCFSVIDLELTRKRMCALSVNSRKIDRLRPGTHFTRNIFDWNIEDYCSCLPMDIAACVERLDKRRIV